jgi:hypothetical protein
MRWTGYVAPTGKDRQVCKVLVEKTEERDHSEDQGIDGRMGSQWILERVAEGCGVDPSDSGQGWWLVVVNVVMSLQGSGATVGSFVSSV